MNRVEFLNELERLLSDMPADERQAAVEYYADYLADAGEENEAETLRELGSPKKVAESIKADYYGTAFDEAKFDHKDYMEKYGRRFEEHGQGAAPDSAQTQNARNGAQGKDPGEEQEDTGEKKEPWTSGWLKLILIALIVIVAGPVAIGIACAVFGLIAGIIALFIGLVIAAIAVMITGIVMVIAGLALIVIPPAAMVVIGIGILLFVLGLMATVGIVKACMVVFPAMLRGFVDLCRRPFHRKAVQ